MDNTNRPPLIDPAHMRSELEACDFTHVVWIPDSTFGRWEGELEQSTRLQLIRVCREGEAWPLAAGLHLGGQRPLVAMQSTGLFESGDALRNVLFDLEIPLAALIGGRNLLVKDSRDSARRFVHPVLQAWQVAAAEVGGPDQLSRLGEHFLACRARQIPGFVLLAEGAG